MVTESLQIQRRPCTSFTAFAVELLHKYLQKVEVVGQKMGEDISSVLKKLMHTSPHFIIDPIFYQHKQMLHLSML